MGRLLAGGLLDRGHSDSGIGTGRIGSVGGGCVAHWQGFHLEIGAPLFLEKFETKEG